MTRDEVLTQARETMAEIAKPFAKRADELQARAMRVPEAYRGEINRQLVELDREYRMTLEPFVKQYATILGMLPPAPMLMTADGQFLDVPKP